MTPKKAIEILEREVHDITLSADPDVPDAFKLGIEALKRHQHNSACFEKGVVKPLPGETED